jgi:hypothetical protein
MGNLFSKQEKYLPRCKDCWKIIREKDRRYATREGDICMKCWEIEFKKTWKINQ